MNDNPLGKKISFTSNYDNTLLFAIPRETNRKNLFIKEDIFDGYDIWNCYEFTFLDRLGKPLVYILKIAYSCRSKNIVESKSLKLYLGSFAMTKFNCIDEVLDIIKRDLREILKTDILEINSFESKYEMTYSKIPYNLLIDNLNIETDEYTLNPGLLKKEINNTKKFTEIYSNLLKTNCPITGQPDYATLYVKYLSDYKIEESSLLKYIISFRGHGDYHENCCEKIFTDIFNLINPELLVVKCFFTRRGGIDINPMRFYRDRDDINSNFHYWRQ